MHTAGWLSPTLDGSTVHLYWLNLAAQRPHAARYLPLLDSTERQRASRYRAPIDRDTFTVARGSLRVLLGAYLGVAPARVMLSANAYGKPQLADPAAWLHFNLTHSGDFALYALAALPVGVDLERVQPLSAQERADLAALVFTVQERVRWQQRPQDAQLTDFYATWTRKEALIKGVGMGLSLPIHTLDLPPTRSALMLDGARWQVCPLSAPQGYHAALAGRASVALRLQTLCIALPLV